MRSRADVFYYGAQKGRWLTITRVVRGKGRGLVGGPPPFDAVWRRLALWQDWMGIRYFAESGEIPQEY